MMRLIFASLCAIALFHIAFAADPPEEPKLTLAQAKAKFDESDHALNDAWAVVKKALAESDFVKLREDQRAWVEWRGYIASALMFSGVTGDDKQAHKSPGYFSMAAELSDDRTTWLLALAKQTKHSDDTLTGRWSDSCNGNVDIVEKDGQIYFNFDVVRGRGSNIGSICGVAVWHSRIGWFSDKGRDKEKTDEANLSFVLHDPILEVTEAGADYYHGHSATFDGHYVKVKTLDAKEQEETIKAGKTGEAPGR